MAYENINVNKLRSALNKIDDINSSSLESLNNKLSSSEWSGGIVNRIKTATKKDISEIKEIQKKINNYKTACNYMEEYQDLDDDIKSYNSSLSSYRSDLNYYNGKLSNHKRTMRNYDSNTSDISRDYTQGRIDYYNQKVSSMNSKISNVNSKLSNAKSRQATLKTKIDNLIN